MYIDFLDIMCYTLNSLKYSVNITFICTEKAKSSCNPLYYPIHFIVMSGTKLTVSPRYASISLHS